MQKQTNKTHLASLVWFGSAHFGFQNKIFLKLNVAGFKSRAFTV